MAAFPTYCSRDEVRDVLTRDAEDVANNGASLDNEVLDKAIVDAQSEIDSRLTARYTVPFSPVPSIVNAICQDIAAYLADLTFRQNRDHQSELSPVYLRYQRSMALLVALQTGETRIPPDGGDPEPTGGGAVAVGTVTRPPLISAADVWNCGPEWPDYWTPEGWAIH